LGVISCILELGLRMVWHPLCSSVRLGQGDPFAPGNSMANAEEDHSGAGDTGSGGKGKGPSLAGDGSGGKGNGGKGKGPPPAAEVSGGKGSGGKGEGVSPAAAHPPPPANDAVVVSQLPGGAAGWSSNWQMWEAQCDLAATSPFAKQEVGHNIHMNWGAELEFPGIVIDGNDGIEGDGTKALGNKSRIVKPSTKPSALTSATRA